MLKLQTSLSDVMEVNLCSFEGFHLVKVQDHHKTSEQAEDLTRARVQTRFEVLKVLMAPTAAG